MVSWWIVTFLPSDYCIACQVKSFTHHTQSHIQPKWYLYMAGDINEDSSDLMKAFSCRVLTIQYSCGR